MRTARNSIYLAACLGTLLATGTPAFASKSGEESDQGVTTTEQQIQDDIYEEEVPIGAEGGHPTPGAKNVSALQALFKRAEQEVNRKSGSLELENLPEIFESNPSTMNEVKNVMQELEDMTDSMESVQEAVQRLSENIETVTEEFPEIQSTIESIVSNGRFESATEAFQTLTEELAEADLDGQHSVEESTSQAAARRRARKTKIIAAVATLFVLLVIGGGAYFRKSAPIQKMMHKLGLIGETDTDNENNDNYDDYNNNDDNDDNENYNNDNNDSHDIPDTADTTE